MCWLSRVKGGVGCCGVCYACLVVRGRRARCCLCGYWRVVGDGMFLPLFCLSRVSDVFSGELGGALGFGLSCFCVRSVVDYGCEVACEW